MLGSFADWAPRSWDDELFALRRELEHCGIDAADAHWVVDELTRLGVLQEGRGHGVWPLSKITKVLGHLAPLRDLPTMLVVIVHELLQGMEREEAPDGRSFPRLMLQDSDRSMYGVEWGTLAAFMRSARDRGVDWTDGLIRTCKLRRERHFAHPDPWVEGNYRCFDSNSRWLAMQFHELGVLEVVRACDARRWWEASDEAAAEVESLDDAGKEAVRRNATDPTHPLFWLSGGVSLALALIRTAFTGSDAIGAARLTNGCLADLRALKHASRAMDDQSFRFEDWREHWRARFRELFTQIDQRIEDPRAVGGLVRRAWLRTCHYGLNFELEVSTAHRQRLCAAADSELGHLRAELRQLAAEDGARLLAARDATVRRCADTLFEYGPLHKAIRAVFLLLRELKCPVVGPDLRWWHEPGAGADPPRPWGTVASILGEAIHRGASLAIEADPRLAGCRSELAEFALERLKSRRPPLGERDPRARTDRECTTAKSPMESTVGSETSSPIEPDPRWRMAWIRVVEALGVNPKGRGHTVLYHAYSSDPDPEVRLLAKGVYAEVRQRTVPRADDSPRRALFGAYAALREAQFTTTSNGAPIDRDALQRTLAREVRQTMPQEQLFREHAARRMRLLRAEKKSRTNLEPGAPPDRS